MFKECIESILQFKFPFDIEIIVNNDNKDIEEIPGAKYFYETSDDISDLYKFVYDQAQGEYVYYLEDDDLLLPEFYQYVCKHIDEADLHVGLFETNLNIIKLNVIQTMLGWRHGITCTDHFQLSQMLFKKIPSLKFPSGNVINNDANLFKSVLEHYEPKITMTKFYELRIHGQNMSKEYFDRWKEKDDNCTTLRTN